MEAEQRNQRVAWDGLTYCADCRCRPAEYQRPFAMIDGTMIVELICYHCHNIDTRAMKKPAVDEDIVTRLHCTYNPIGCGECTFCVAKAEIERLRNAIDSVLINIDSDHQPEWASTESKAAGKKPWCCQWCGPQEGGWPCVHRMVLDELKEARRG